MNETQMIRIAYAEDQHLVRKAILAMINRFLGIRVVIEAANGKAS